LQFPHATSTALQPSVCFTSSIVFACASLGSCLWIYNQEKCLSAAQPQKAHAYVACIMPENAGHLQNTAAETSVTVMFDSIQ